MRHQPPHLADTEIDRWLAEHERDELGVDVGDMDQCHVAERLEAQQFLLRQALLRQRPRPAARQNRRGCGRHLQKIAPREHSALPHNVRVKHMASDDSRL